MEWLRGPKRRSDLVFAVVATVLAGIVIALFASYRSEPAPDALSTVPDPIPEPAVIVREATPPGASVATFAGGCFWCIEAAFQEADGVTNAISGYAGGPEIDPTYRDVYTGSTGHREAVQVYFDPAVVSYDDLLEVFWRSIDPTDSGGQFVDRGLPYTTAVFAHDDEQRTTARASVAALEASGRFDADIVTPVLPFTTFYEAEDYHQDYYLKSPERYTAYEEGSGREAFKARAWQEIQRSS